MMILVIGGSGSGKSAYAEKAVELLLQEDDRLDTDCGVHRKKYYLATMRVSDEEAIRKVDRHRKLRSGKGFFTIEQPKAIHKALAQMEAGNRTVLLECMSNLIANEMFSEDGYQEAGQVAEEVITSMKMLKEHTTHLVVVSNNVFEDGRIYDEATMGYLLAIGKVNEKLAAMADQVVEVVAGIPVVIKCPKERQTCIS